MIGGKLNSAGVNAKLGQSPYFVVEADESDASILIPQANDGLMILMESYDTYEDDFDKLKLHLLSSYITYHSLRWHGKCAPMIRKYVLFFHSTTNI